MERIVKPVRAISFEEALRNLASRLTGTPVAELPRTQEAIVQYMADNINLPGAPTQVVTENITVQGIPGLDVDKVCEAITQEVMARLKLDELADTVAREATARIADGAGGNPAALERPGEAQDGDGADGGTSTLPTAEMPQEAPQMPTEPAPKPKGGRRPKTEPQT
ncbi:MAG: hypothetical protein K1W21_19535 [Oscillospiraceae bacterium]